MRGKRLTEEEKKDRCNYCLSKVLKFKADELNYENFNFIKDNSYNIDCYVFKKNRAINMEEFHKKWRHRTGLVEESNA